MAPLRKRSLIPVLGLGLLMTLPGCRQESSLDHDSQGDQSISTMEPAGHRPNVLFILVDTLRADRLGLYGHPEGLSPTIDRLGREGVVFDRAVAQAPWTQPSVASLFTSQYPTVHGVLDYRHAYRAAYGDQDVLPALSDSVVTMAEIFREAGYTTAGFVANPFVSADFGFAQGFDHFDDSFASNTTPGSKVNSAFLRWVAERETDRPFFAFLHYMDVHGPYDGNPEILNRMLDTMESSTSLKPLTREEREGLGYLARLPSRYDDLDRHQRLAMYREYWYARYEAGVATLDGFLAELEDELRAGGLWDDLYIVLTSDHGEALVEHGHWDHGSSVHNPELHVPLILRWTSGIEGGKRVHGPVQLIDLVPTLSQQLGLRQIKKFQGSLLPLGNEEPDSHGPAFAEATKASPTQEAAYSGNWKIVIEPEANRVELYDLASDPLEQVDVSEQHSSVVDSLMKIWLNQKTRNEELRGSVPPEMAPVSPELRERLDALGYLD